ncbi:unnamed protein product [Symbiodinium pilosum]|uniref:Uncharacterized protein n=1 Tax=Symbiodinium pilosum TaxID=2952 RepID=A0A812YA19_SYMPI|nr:unnamed protein product [Symbiodinium pilosum]
MPVQREASEKEATQKIKEKASEEKEPAHTTKSKKENSLRPSSSTQRSEEIFDGNLQRLKRFLIEHQGQWPLYRSSDAIEKRLYNWMLWLTWAFSSCSIGHH